MTASAKLPELKPTTGGSDTMRSSNAGKRIRSADLLNGKREVLIEHAGELYSLRHTSKGKLILTK